MKKGELDIDARGLIHESFRIEGITGADCRTIFLDWALGLPDGADPVQAIRTLLDHYAADQAGHPMIAVLEEGVNGAARRPTTRRGRARRSQL